MTKINSIHQKAVRIQVVVCGLLFSIFSFVYLFVFQRDILEALHFSLANGKTHFSPLGSALVMMLTLLLLTWGVNSIVKFKGRYHALAYMPSFFVLMAMSDVGRDVYVNGGNTTWQWLLPILICAFTGGAFLCKKAIQSEQNDNDSTASLLGSNLLFLLLGSLGTVCIGNTDSTFHHELQAERYLREKDYSNALRVGDRSLDASRTLTALRAFSLSHVGQVGEKLFTYPQYFGADGLFLADDSLQTLRYTNDSIYENLGARPYSGESQLVYLSNLCYQERGRYIALDYFLSALLLEKKIDSFAEAVNDFFEPGDSLPLHFREAMLIYQDQHTETAFVCTDSLLIDKFSAYKQRKTDFKSKIEETNQMHREFGNTYWWYYDYQK